jgi:manganese/zinc/iron transport system permease protein
MVGMLIAPGIAARQWTHKLDQMVILSAVFGAFAGGTGAILSAVDADVPTGPMIIVVAFAIVTISIAFAPGRGLAWSLLRRRGDRKRFAAQQTLRDLYKYAISHGGASYPVPASFIEGVGGANVKTGLAQLEYHGHIKADGNVWCLTASGARLAEQDARNQQLWDVYREFSDELDIPLIAEDRQRDIHEMLPQAALEKLDHKLKEVLA